MMKIFLTLVSLLVFDGVINAQFSVEKFLDEKMDNDYKSVKVRFKDKNLDEITITKFKSLVYFDYMDPISIKVGYLFDNNGNQKGKVIMNGKENEKDAETLFNMLLPVLEKKFSDNYSKSNIGNLVMINWKGLKHLTVILSQQDKKAMLTIVKK